MYMEPLIGPRITLRPLLASDGPALVQAATDGELWKLPLHGRPFRENRG